MAKIDIEKERQRFQAMLENPQSNVERAFKEEHLAKGSYPREWNDDTVSSCNLFYRCFENGYNAAARRQHGSAAQAVEPVAEMYLRMMNWNGRGRPDDPPPTPFVDVRWFNRDLPAGTKLYTAPPVADAEGVKALGDLRQAKAALDAIEAVNSRRGTPEHHAAAARYQAAVDALVLAALSRRPAAAAESLADRFDKFVAEPPVGAAEQPAAEQAKAAHVGWRNEKDGRPAAAGNALTDEQIEEIAEGFYASPTTDAIYNVIGFGQAVASAAIAQHLRAAPQQGEGLTWDEAQRICDLPDVDEAIRGLIEDSTGDNAVCMVQAIAAHTRASDGKDAERLDWLVAECAVVHEHGTRYRLYWTEHDEYQSEFYPSPRAAIDAAMQQAASNQQEGAK